ncbi:MAG TPA: FAD-dependent thymidylate synthase [Gammaproteobacteria bacterium]|nr:FAD-dependent thymidylate synthase [Gammaproteobacteria bacterium]
MKFDLYNDGVGTVELMDHMGTDLTIVNSARVSFGKQKETLDKQDEKLIKYLTKHRHTSTFEHNVATFRFKVPLFVARQHMRHRTWSYNEISRRYTDFNIEFYEPDSFRTQHTSNRQASNEDNFDPVLYNKFDSNVTTAVKNHHQNSLELYNTMIDAGVCREQARGILPQNMYTEYYGTCNLSNLLKFIELRTHKGAQQEIQVVAQGILNIIEELWPHAVTSYIKHRGISRGAEKD